MTYFIKMVVNKMHDIIVNKTYFTVIMFTVKPVAVNILNKEKQISADKKYEVECKAVGSRPEATITWWKGSRQVHKMAKTVTRVSHQAVNTCT